MTLKPQFAAQTSTAKKLFKDLCAKHGVRPTEAAALKCALPLDEHEMITESGFLAGRKSWLAAPAGR